GNSNETASEHDISWFDDNSLEAVLPLETTLYQNYPNPFNPDTSIKFFNKLNGEVRLTVFNTKGEMVRELLNSNLTSGMHSVKFNAAGLNSGLYYYSIRTADKNIVRKLISSDNKLVLTSEFSESYMFNQAKDSGCDDFIVNPFGVEEVKFLLKRLYD
ncbi:MAG: T9SS type A sorting domain-containing protein, partial [Proteobacteria bacterium]|nr:T9SS type A sorting domain-containing protein [Pseudomonadota bacterium]